MLTQRTCTSAWDSAFICRVSRSSIITPGLGFIARTLIFSTFACALSEKFWI